MKALILAAGRGTRVSSETRGLPKCLLEVHGSPLLEHQLRSLAACGVTDVTVVTGYAREAIEARFGGRVDFHHYPRFAETNNLHTLHHAREHLHGGAFVLFADVLVPHRSLERLSNQPADLALLCDLSACRESTMRVVLEARGIADLGSHVSVAEGSGNFIGIARYSARGAELLTAELERMLAEPTDFGADYYTRALGRISSAGHRVDAVSMEGDPWIEIDTPEDLAEARAADFYLAP